MMRIYFFAEGPKFEAATREEMLAAALELAFGPCKADVRSGQGAQISAPSQGALQCDTLTLGTT